MSLLHIKILDLTKAFQQCFMFHVKEYNGYILTVMIYTDMPSHTASRLLEMIKIQL